MTTFALVHGAWHSAWCWERVTPLLQQAGHDVVTPELPSEDGSADFDCYADLVCATLRGCDDDVVVVAHSLGGATGALIPGRRPVRHLVYLCAAVPQGEVGLFDQWQAQPDMVATTFSDGWLGALSEPDEQLRTQWVDRDFARKVFYADCDEATAADAFDHLRPQSGYPWTLPCSLTQHPAVRCTSVVCSDDRIVNPVWSRRAAREIGADIVELPGSHSPFLSRPPAVADVLLRVAEAS
ncbi:alpha/beta hydrolase [Mycobacterium barrassiae]|uniref:alpha/beta fold hydrolase n=1 Tax=Mycobacterium barrassiae TaxID=319709 RepID=UPI002265D740|nr:alpha/beta hydrolase [Mycobacterium barrassiae]MCV7301782.1 alpha/beta hydrolase [Mycobacterium barrassiae]